MANNQTINQVEDSMEDLVKQLNHEEVIRLIPMFIFLLLISVIGIPGNGLVCYIYSAKYGASSSRWFIFFLASADLVMCIIIVPCEMATSLYQYNFTSGIICKLTAFLNNWSLMTLGFILVIVSIDRYRKVCRPLGWQIDSKKARILSICATVAAFLTSLPLWWVYDIHRDDHKQSNVTVSRCSFEESSSAFYLVLFGIVLFVSSLATICVLYCFIGRAIKRHMRKKKVRRKVCLSASTAQSDVICTSFSQRDVIFSTTQSGIFSHLKRKESLDEHFEKGRKISPPTYSNDRSLDDQISTNFTDGETFDFAATSPPSKPIERKRTKRLRRARARKATFSMFLISFAFVLSYLPMLVLLLIRSIDGSFEENLSNASRAMYKFFLRSYFLNCSINPFIYGLSDSSFRKNCKDVFYKLWMRVKG